MIRRLLVLLILAVFVSPLAAADRPSNVVLIMTDNHGPWTLGCYGNPDVQTPNIDRLAAEGTLYTRGFASNAVCSPTRATFLTGLIPSQHGVHCYLSADGLQTGPNAVNTIAEFRSLPVILHENGYVCGLSGKWHLGKNLEPQSGFTTWLTKPHGDTQGFYDQQVIQDGRIHVEPEYLTDFWTDHGVQFIEANRDRPFFLFLAYNGPYGLGNAMLEPVRNRWKDFYADKSLDSFPMTKPHPWLVTQLDLLASPDARRKYAAEISGIDDGVGRIMQTLGKLGLDDNTLVIFTSDQGLAGGQNGFWGMGDHTRPLSAYDSMISMPLIFREPGQVAAGQRRDEIVSNYDLLPTVLDYLHIDGKLPAKPELPGHSLAPLLAGQSPDWDNTMYFEYENVRAIRTADWKYIERFHQEPNELYDLRTDPDEQHNLIDDPAQAATRQELQDRLHAFFARYADPQYDLWHGGRSKTHLITRKLFGLDNPERPAAKNPE